MSTLMEQASNHKSNITDGAVVVAGGVYASISEHLPIIIGILTAILLIGRIYLVYQECKLNKRKLKSKIKDAVNDL